jgi:hypothetical protein
MKSPSARGTLSQRDERKGLGILARLFEDAIRRGQINVQGKSEAELTATYHQFLDDLAGVDQFEFAIDHTRDLLHAARHFSNSGSARVATLLYATWIEHWVNHLVAVAAQRHGLQPCDTAELIRDVPLRSKLGWLSTLLRLKPIAPSHRKQMLNIVELRNSFVHYKWRTASDDSITESDRSFQAAVARFQKTVAYLHRYEAAQFLPVPKRKIRRAVG